MSIIKKLQENKKMLFTFENSFYESDIWDTYLIPEVKEAAKKIQMRNFNFTSIENELIRNEFKGFILDVMKNRAFSTTTSYTRTMNVLNRFLSERYRYITTILELDRDIIFEEYRDWLTKGGYSTSRETTKRVTGDMKLTKYESDTMYVIVLRKFYDFISNYINIDKTKEYDKESWDVRKLGIPITIIESRPRYTINFKKILQEDFKSVCKKYCFHRLQNKAVSTVLEHMKAINHFSEFLNKHYPNLAFNEVSRAVLVEYFQFARTSKMNTSTLNKRIGNLKTFFDTIQLMGLKGIPDNTLIVANDYRRKEKTLPKFFSDNEIKAINKHIDQLPIQVARMLFVIQNVGLRISDLCGLKVDCLKVNTNGDYLLSYYQPKTRKTNIIPVNEIVAATINKAIECSKEEFGEDCKYVFAKSEKRPISTEYFSNYLNNMSYDNDLKDDIGNPLRIKSHVFRGTVATKYANLGIDLSIIKMMLGQSTVGVLKHYITIHDINMIDSLKVITEEDNRLIESIGNIEAIAIDKEENKEAIPLPNGWCTKSLASGKCSHANACYTCRMFKPSKNKLQLYKKQLRDTENNIQAAELNGFERLLDINKELRDNLLMIIAKVEGGSV